jgi:type II pantothenate kinase
LLSVIFCGKATGGGAYKYADVFKERLGVSLEKEDEMDCLVAGANFLLKVPNSNLFSPYSTMHLSCM